MQLSYHEVKVDNQIWQMILEKDLTATYYQSPAWSKIIVDSFRNWRETTKMFEFSDGNIAVIPEITFAISGFVDLWSESTGLGGYGGVLFLNKPTCNQIKFIEDQIDKKNNFQYSLFPTNRIFDITSIKSHVVSTQILDLNSTNIEPPKLFHKSRRESIRYALKAGIIIEKKLLRDYLDEYYAIYKDQRNRWGLAAGARYPKKLFESIASEQQINENIEFWLAKLDEKVISGVICFRNGNNNIVLWNSVTRTEYQKFRAVDLLYSKVIQAAYTRGTKYLDFGQSGNNPGLTKYKEHFGTRIMPVKLIYRKNFIGYLYRAYRLSRSIFMMESIG